MVDGIVVVVVVVVAAANVVVDVANVVSPVGFISVSDPCCVCVCVCGFGKDEDDVNPGAKTSSEDDKDTLEGGRRAPTFNGSYFSGAELLLLL